MSHKSFIVVVLALLGVACAAPEVRQAPVTPTPDRAAAWLQSLAAAVGERRVLQLGESGHGMAETYQLKTEAVRYFHQQHGFDVLAVEGGLAECWVAAQHLGEWSAEQSMQACFWDAWASEEAAALFEYLRSTAASDRPLRLVGFDNSPTSRAFATWLEGRPDLPPALLAAEREFLRIFAGAADESDTLAAIQTRAVMEYRRAYQELDNPMLAMIIEDRLATLDFDPADFDRAAFERDRERRMASNLLRHLQNEPGARVIVWAHNAHIAHAYSEFVGDVRRQGEFVHSVLGAESYTVGVYPLSGEGYAWFINQDYEIRPPQPGSLEARLAELPGDPVFLDLHGAAAQQQPWTRQPVTSFEWGLNEQLIVPVEMYDGLLLIRAVTPITRDRDGD